MSVSLEYKNYQSKLRNVRNIKAWQKFWYFIKRYIKEVRGVSYNMACESVIMYRLVALALRIVTRLHRKWLTFSGNRQNSGGFYPTSNC